MFSENIGIESSGAYVLWISTGIFVCSALGLLALSTKYPPNSMMVFFICSVYTTIASVAYLIMALGEGKLKDATITRSSVDNKFYVQNQIKLPVIFYPRCILYHNVENESFGEISLFMQVLPLVPDIPSHIALCRGLSYHVTGKFAQCETGGPVMITYGLDVSASLITRAQSIKVLNLNSGNNVFGNVVMCFSMLVFLVVSVIVPQNNGFQRFISWFVGVLLGLNLINNIRLLSGLAKKKLVKGNRLIVAGKSSQDNKVAACLCFLFLS